jgi:hypothetical protein
VKDKEAEFSIPQVTALARLEEIDDNELNTKYGTLQIFRSQTRYFKKLPSKSIRDERSENPGKAGVRAA